MRLLVLGYSAIVQKRVLPALRSLPNLELHMATRRADALRGALMNMGVHEVHDDYERALDNARAQAVYVSLPNALHARFVRAALLRGLHVLVDKPALLDLPEAEACLQLAAQQGVLLAEATVWDRHPVWTRLAALQAETGCTWRHIAATFAFPHFTGDNFRNSSLLGGGALHDLGPYAASCARRFLGPADRLTALALAHDCGKDGVDLAFALLAGRGGCALSGQFGFGAAYTNRLELIGDTARFVVEPAFTSPADAWVVLRWRHRDIEHATPVDPADSFALFIGEALADAQAGPSRHAPWAQALLEDARFLHRLRQAHQETIAGSHPLDRVRAPASSHRPPSEPLMGLAATEAPRAATTASGESTLTPRSIPKVVAAVVAPVLPRTLAEAQSVAPAERRDFERSPAKAWS